jgi:hypothetical protein
VVHNEKEFSRLVDQAVYLGVDQPAQTPVRRVDVCLFLDGLESAPGL